VSGRTAARYFLIPETVYRVVIGVLGIVFDGASDLEAKRQFDQFVIQSHTAGSRFFGEPVRLFKNQAIIAEYHPPEVADSFKESPDTSDDKGLQ
jgi:hypothetical protein